MGITQTYHLIKLVYTLLLVMSILVRVHICVHTQLKLQFYNDYIVLQ